MYLLQIQLFLQKTILGLLTNIYSSNIGDHQSELHVFDLMIQLLINGCQLNLVTQYLIQLKQEMEGFSTQKYHLPYKSNSSKNHYGKSFGINRVIAVNSNKYFEKVYDFELSNFLLIIFILMENIVLSIFQEIP